MAKRILDQKQHFASTPKSFPSALGRLDKDLSPKKAWIFGVFTLEKNKFEKMIENPQVFCIFILHFGEVFCKIKIVESDEFQT
ncbi:MAG: hypothetical protein ACI4L5_04170 [Negativibacillus sp.]